MATAQKITRANYQPLLKRSATGRGNSPDGNYFIDLDGDQIQLITIEENATVDLGFGLEANPLTNVDKVQLLAIYFDILEEAQADTAVQNFLNQVDAVGNRMGNLVGAMAFINGVKLASGTVDANAVGGSLGDDRLKLADTGFTEFAAGGGGNTLIDRIYHGATSQPLDPGSQPYYMLAPSGTETDRQATATLDFSKLGTVNEVIQTFGSTGNGDAGAGNFDSLNDTFIMCVRSFGFRHGESQSTTELGAYSRPYGLSEVADPALTGIVESEVFGGGVVAPYDALTFSIPTADQSETGFVEGDGLFDKIIANPAAGASLVQIRAWMDKFSQQDTDQNTNTGNTGAFLPKRAETLYFINDEGKVEFRQGVFVDLPAGDQQDAVFRALDGSTRTRPFNSGLIFLFSPVWFNDTDQHFRGMFKDVGANDFDTATAITIQDVLAADVAGDKLDSRISILPSGDYALNVSFPYDSDTLGGTAGTDKDCVMRVGGESTSKTRFVEFTIERIGSKTIDCRSDAETN